MQIRDVRHHVGRPGSPPLTILAGVDLNVAAGSSVSIMGRSGSGKSTLLSLMGLLNTPTHGQVLVGGRDSSTMSEAGRARLRNEHVGFIFQNYSLMPTWTVLQNCQLPLLYRRRGRPTDRTRTGVTPRDRASALLDRLGLGDRLDATPAVLSGGEQQRVAIARALVHEPDLVLADEPTGALDETTADTVLQVLFDATRASGCALVIVTHDDQVAARADIRYDLNGGTLHRVRHAASQ